ncbi:MAG: N-acetyltransferase [bacterium]|nr:N-acetyltransferase [bacterium]
MAACTTDSTRPDAASELAVRRPDLTDFPTILEISNWATCHTAANFNTEPETLEHWVGLWQGKAQRYPWFVAERNGSVVGFAMASPFAGRCGFAYTAEVSVYVHPKHVREGVGQALYGELIPTLRVQGFHTLLADITIPNPASERLHEKHGFEKVGLLRQVGWKLGRWHDVGQWQCILDAGAGPPEAIKTVPMACPNGEQTS